MFTRMLTRTLVAVSLTAVLSLGVTMARGPQHAMAAPAYCGGYTGSLSHEYGYTDGKGNVEYAEKAGAQNPYPTTTFTVKWHDNTNGNSWDGSSFTVGYQQSGGITDDQWLQLGHNYTVTLWPDGVPNCTTPIATDNFDA